MPLKMGSIAWMKLYDYEGLRAYYNEKNKQYRAAHPEKRPGESARYRIKNCEALRQRKAKYYAANKEKRRHYVDANRDHIRASRKIECACGRMMSRYSEGGKATVCRQCAMFVRWLAGGQNPPSRLCLEKHIGTFTKEDVGQWQNVTTQRKAMQLRKQILKRLSKTLQSQISEKKPESSHSGPAN